jgi:hypothetical protein
MKNVEYDAEDGTNPALTFSLAQQGQPCICEGPRNRPPCPHFRGHKFDQVDCALRGFSRPVTHCTGPNLKLLKGGAT